jgi:hypothetical protein
LMDRLCQNLLHIWQSKATRHEFRRPQSAAALCYRLDPPAGIVVSVH